MKLGIISYDRCHTRAGASVEHAPTEWNAPHWPAALQEIVTDEQTRLAYDGP